MRPMSKWWLAIAVGGLALGLSLTRLAAQDCPARPNSGTVVADPFSIYSQNGALNAKLTLGHSIDISGYTHFCYKYQSPTGVVESPTLARESRR